MRVVSHQLDLRAMMTSSWKQRTSAITAVHSAFMMTSSSVQVNDWAPSYLSPNSRMGVKFKTFLNKRHHNQFQQCLLVNVHRWKSQSKQHSLMDITLKSAINNAHHNQNNFSQWTQNSAHWGIFTLVCNFNFTLARNYKFSYLCLQSKACWLSAHLIVDSSFKLFFFQWQTSLGETFMFWVKTHMIGKYNTLQCLRQTQLNQQNRKSSYSLRFPLERPSDFKRASERMLLFFLWRGGGASLFSFFASCSPSEGCCLSASGALSSAFPALSASDASTSSGIFGMNMCFLWVDLFSCLERIPRV